MFPFIHKNNICIKFKIIENTRKKRPYNNGLFDSFITYKTLYISFMTSHPFPL